MSAPAAPQSLAARLGQSRVGLNPDLEVSRHVFRGESAYVIRNPLTLQNHLFSAEDYGIIVRIRSERSLGETFEELVAEEVLAEDREETFYQFVLSLHRLGFLQLPISDEKILYRRFAATQKAKRMQKLTSVFFLQVPLVNPDAFLDRTMVVARVLFSRWFFAVWSVLVGLALVLGIQNAGELAEPLKQIAVGANLPVLFTVLLVLKLFHEFGHAYACKRFGGVVPEMGVYLIIFTPCAYVDTSSSWSFPRKRDRLLVCLGGMYVELFFAALGMLVWAATPPGFLNQLAYEVALLASVVTVGFNINPLMRFDGYYALSDAVEVPNLRARAQERVGRVLKRLFLGLPDPRSGEGSGMRAFLATFGVASAIYKVMLVLGISAVIASKYFAAGFFLAGFYVAMELFRLIRKAIGVFFASRETAAVRLRAAVVGALVLVLLPIGVCTLPLPAQVVAPAVLSAKEEQVLRSERAGFLSVLFVEAPQAVSSGEVLMLLEDPGIDEAVLEAQAELELARLRLRVAQVEDPVTEAEHEERVRLKRNELDTRLRERSKLTIRAPGNGRVVRSMPGTDRGRHVAEGEPLATIVSGPVVARALLTERQIERARPQPGARIEFRSTADPLRTLTGMVARVEPMGSAVIDEVALTSAGGGDILVDPVRSEAEVPHFVVTIALDPVEDFELRHGSTGRVWLAGSRESLGKLLWRGFLSFRHRLVTT